MIRTDQARCVLGRHQVQSEVEDRRTPAFIAADEPIVGAADRWGESIAAIGEFSSGPVRRRRRSVVGNYVQSAWVLLLVYGLNSDKEGNLTDVSASPLRPIRAQDRDDHI